MPFTGALRLFSSHEYSIISVFISGGISGFFLAQPAIDTYLHATYFVVAHFHFVMAVAAIFGIFAAT